MLQGWVIVLASLSYLGILFAIAWYADRRADTGRSLIANPVVYALSLGVYCTTWTFYGSVGRAATTGVGFLPIYLGPTLMAALWWFVLRKIIREEKLSVILVEQNARRALQIADRGYVLETGRVVLGGDRETLLADPRVQHAYLGT